MLPPKVGNTESSIASEDDFDWGPDSKLDIRVTTKQDTAPSSADDFDWGPDSKADHRVTTEQDDGSDIDFDWGP